MNPYHTSIENLTKQLNKLVSDKHHLEEKLIINRDLVLLYNRLKQIDGYLQKTRRYNYWGYFIDDWKETIERSGMPIKLQSILYLEKLGYYPLNNILNKTRRNLEKVNPWNVGQLEKDIKDNQCQLDAIKKRVYFKSISKINQLTSDIEQQEHKMNLLLNKEKQERAILEYSKKILRQYVNKWKKIEKKEALIADIKKKIEHESPYKEVHDLAYAKAASADNKTRSLASQKRDNIKKSEICPYCNELLGSSPHLDHIHPVNLGGLSTKENLVWCCPKCNLKKSNKGLIEFLKANNRDIESVCDILLNLGKTV